MQNKRTTFNKVLQVMKFTVLQLILVSIAFISLQAKNTNAQEILKQKVTINAEGVQLQTVLDQIENQTDVSFTYSPQLIQTDQEIFLRADKEQLKAVLKNLFTPLSINFQIFNNRTIVLTKELKSNPGIGKVKALPPVKGMVKDEDGLPLIGATVFVKGTTTGTVTDADGSFSIDCNTGDILVVSYTGYATQEVEVTGGDLNITLSEGVALESVTVLGSRGKPRTDVDRPVPIDVISSKELISTGQQDLGQSLQYSAPSFNAVKFGINDLAPLVDPASLRGLSPDQTLLLVNGKRRHKVAFFNNNSGVGKGQLANDINAIPSLAVKRVEILRDGAAAQYGSDAIAGVMNMQLNDAREGGSVRIYTGSSLSKPKYDDLGDNADLSGENIYGDDFVTDGRTFSASANFGLGWGEEGFVNTTLHFSHSEPSDRSGTYNHSAGWFTEDQIAAAGLTTDEELLAVRGIDLNRAVLGTAENTNLGVFVNAGRPINDNWDFYTFGGLTNKEVIGGVFSRSPTRSTRRVLELFPNGYNPEVPSVLNDWQISSGIKGEFGDGWGLDFSAGYSGNNVDLYARNTVNPSLGAASPTSFYTGSLNVTQTVFNADLNKQLSDKVSLAVGVEQRYESFQQSQGQIESFVAGPDATRPVFDSLGVQIGVEGFKDVGSSGREGFTDRSDGEWTRNNTGIYAELEADVTDDFLIAGAARYENYSDFGGDVSYKIASRYKITDKIAVRGSVNRSFRAPGLAQYQYSNFASIEFDNDGNSVVSPFLPIRDQLVQSAFGIENLDPETSFDIALGVTAKLARNFTVTIDAYQIAIDNRIVGLGGIDPSLFSEFDGAGYDAVSIFTNAVNTETQGLDIVLNYRNTYDNGNRLGLTLAGNFNSTEIPEDGINLPERLSDFSISSNDLIYLTNGTPQRKIIGTIDYSLGGISFLARATNFGEVSEPRVTDPDTDGPQILRSKTVVDFSVTGHISNQFSVTLGANNIFDVYPDMLLRNQVRNEVIYSRRVNQFGTQGRFINLSLNYNW